MSDVHLSIIIPVLNEASIIEPALQALQDFRTRPIEIIVVDGGSDDSSCSIAPGLADRCLRTGRGRAHQMNKGAIIASGKYLLFLHIDTRLEMSAVQLDELFIKETAPWGFFCIRLSGKHPLLRIIEYAMNVRSRLTSIATGDQCLYVRSDLFLEVGGFPEIELMEDIALCKILRKKSRPGVLAQNVVTSSRRWEQRGIIRTVCLMWCLRLAYFLGVRPDRLVKSYYG